MIDRERERERGGQAETQEEGEVGSMLGAPRGTRSLDSRIAPWAKGRRQTAEPPRDPQNVNFLKRNFIAICCNPNELPLELKRRAVFFIRKTLSPLKSFASGTPSVAPCL